MKDLVVADGRLQERVPVDQPLAAVDQPLVEQAEERVPHGPGADRVEREPGPLPVAAAAHLLELAEDAGFVLVLPLPDPLDQRLRGPGRAASSSPPRSSRRSTTACVAMPAWSVPGIQRVVEALHPLQADEDVLQRVVQRMAQVQRAGDVGRRDDDRVRLACRGRARCGSSPAPPRTGTSGPARRRGRIAWEVRRGMDAVAMASSRVRRRSGISA